MMTTTWNLLITKHSKGACPSNLAAPSVEAVLPLNFDIIPVLRSFSKLTGAGPTGLRMQHLIDAAEVPLSCSIHQSLKAVVNILAAGGAPPMLSSFLAGGNLTALVKSKQGCASDICLLYWEKPSIVPWLVDVVLGCGLLHLMLLQLTLLLFVLPALDPFLACISPQQLESLTPPLHHLRCGISCGISWEPSTKACQKWGFVQVRQPSLERPGSTRLMMTNV